MVETGYMKGDGESESESIPMMLRQMEEIRSRVDGIEEIQGVQGSKTKNLEERVATFEKELHDRDDQRYTNVDASLRQMNTEMKWIEHIGETRRHEMGQYIPLYGEAYKRARGACDNLDRNDSGDGKEIALRDNWSGQQHSEACDRIAIRSRRAQEHDDTG
jgi:hypothetical protein